MTELLTNEQNDRPDRQIASRDLAQYRAPLPHVDLINRDILAHATQVKNIGVPFTGMMGGFVTGAFGRRLLGAARSLWQDTHAALFGSADTP